jgi:IclR family acetate operon transcriptional repressor
VATAKVRKRTVGAARAAQKSYAAAVAVERAADTLFLLAEHGEMSVSELARYVGCGRSAIHRIVTALKSKGLVDQDETNERYLISPRVLSIALSPHVMPDLRAFALPGMVELRDKTGETVTLNVRTGAERVCIEQVGSRQEVRWIGGVGRVNPIHTGASGRVLLAYLPPAELEGLLRGTKLKRFTPNTLVDRSAIDRELAKVRRVGYAIGNQDRTAGVIGVSAPVFDRTGSVLAALTIAAPIHRGSIAAQTAWARAVKSAAAGMSRVIADRAH